MGAAALTRERILATRTLGADTGDLLDAALAARLLEACDGIRRDDLIQSWWPYLESHLAGQYAPNPAVHHPRLVPSCPPLQTLFASMRAYFRVGLFWCERSGIPRRWLVEIKGWDRVRLARHVATRLGGFRPLWTTHMPSLPSGLHLSEAEFVRSHLEIARALEVAPGILGIVSASWYFDPAVASVSPHLGFMRRIMAGAGALLFEVPTDDSMRGNALRSAKHRREAHRRGEYEPRAFARVWGREDCLRWAARQPGWQLALPVCEPLSQRYLDATG